MLTDKQLTALINYIRAEDDHIAVQSSQTRVSALKAREELTSAMGFQPDMAGYPRDPRELDPDCINPYCTICRKKPKA